MDSNMDEEQLVAMLLQFRDSLTEMSLMLRDYQANMEVLKNGPSVELAGKTLSVLREKAGIVSVRDHQ